SLRWTPTDATTADLIFNAQRDDTPGIAFKSAVIPVSPVSTDTDPHTPANLNRGAALGVERTVYGLTGIVRHEVGDAWTIVSTSGWRELDGRNEFDADGSYLYLLEIGEEFKGRQFSQEVRAEYDAGERLSATLGANVVAKENRQPLTLRTDENTLWRFFTATPPPFALNRDYLERNVNDARLTSGDVFGRADYKLTDRLTTGGGARLTRERIASGYQSFAAPVTGTLPVPLLPTSGGGNDFFQVTPGRLANSTHETAWAGEADLRYALNPQTTVYTTISRGRRSPVLDFDLVTLAPRESAEETVWNYEAGVRGFSATRRVRYDVSVFQYYFDHFQTQRVVPPGVVQSFDGGRARGQGLDATVQTDLARDLSVFASYGFTDAGFSAQDEDGNAQLYAGDSFRLTSRHVVSVGGTWSVSLDRAGVFFVTPVFTYRSEYFFEDNNSLSGGTLRQGGHGLLNLRLGWRSRDQRWEVVTYATNLLDKEYLLDAGNIGATYGVPTKVPAAPRLVGVSATMRF
nr:TonB-dependent receptor [Opitutaceae bacterium]